MGPLQDGQGSAWTSTGSVCLNGWGAGLSRGVALLFFLAFFVFTVTVLGSESLQKIQRFLSGCCQDRTPTNQLSRETEQCEKNGSRQGIAIFIFSNNNNLYDNDYSVM